MTFNSKPNIFILSSTKHSSMKLPKLVLSFFLFCLLLVGFSLLATAQNNNPTPITPPSTPVSSAPIDGGISILIAAGAAYGAKKIYEVRKKEK